MAEHPCILTGPEVLATLAGTKSRHTVPITSRWMRYVSYIGGGAATDDPMDWGFWTEDDYGRWAVLAQGVNEWEQHGHVSLPCPFGAVGDTLWVRESWLEYEANGARKVAYKVTDCVIGTPWRSPVTMPHWASRLTLELTGVDVRRVQSVTDEEARAHGVDADVQRGGGIVPDGYYRSRLALTWDRRHPKSPWAVNPWCWCLEWKIKEAR